MCLPPSPAARTRRVLMCCAALTLAAGGCTRTAPNPPGSGQAAAASPSSPEPVNATIFANGAKAPNAAPSPQGVAGGPSVLARWVTLVSGGAHLVRAVTAGSTCPTLLADGKRVVMTVHAQPAPPAFPVQVCEARLPRETRSAQLEGAALPVAPAEATRIVVIGDTGCRMKGKHFQDCRDPSDWPVEKLAGAVVAYKPQVVIHVGDYQYRESPCPPGNKICAGLPAGDTWDAWYADFFKPLQPVLDAAPWVMVRGNHEICKRLGQGWFHLLEPSPLPKDGTGCADETDPYLVPLGRVNVAVLDTAIAHDFKKKRGQHESYAEQARKLVALAKGPTFVATHKPIWFVVPSRGDKTVADASVQPVLAATVVPILPPNVELWIAGHKHLFETFGFDTPPTTLISGHSATALLPPLRRPIIGLEVGGRKIIAGASLSEYGFTTLDRAGAGWKLAARNLAGEPRVTCEVRKGLLRCDTPTPKRSSPAVTPASPGR